MVGNTPNFSKMDVLRCFLRLDKNIGRKELAKALSLGEGTMRSILAMLKTRKLLDSTKKGHFLSHRGKNILGNILKSIEFRSNFTSAKIYPKYCKTAIVVKNPKNFKSSYKLRDIAVKNGAEGAVILDDDALEAPEAEIREYFHELEKIFKLQKGNVLIVAFAKNQRWSENGALSIACELSSQLGKFVKEVSK